MLRNEESSRDSPAATAQTESEKRNGSKECYPYPGLWRREEPELPDDLRDRGPHEPINFKWNVVFTASDGIFADPETQKPMDGPALVKLAPDTKLTTQPVAGLFRVLEILNRSAAQCKPPESTKAAETP